HPVRPAVGVLSLRQSINAARSGLHGRSDAMIVRFGCQSRFGKLVLLSGAGLVALSLPFVASAQVQKIGAPPEAKNMRLVGYSDLQARSSYQPVIVHQGNRYIAYIGHHGGSAELPKPLNPMTHQPENNGTSIIDVTDPANPKYLQHIPGDEGAGEGGGA